MADRAMLRFRVGTTRLAVPAEDVSEVVRTPRLTRVPHAPPSLAGVASLRGVVAPVVSLARLLGCGDDGEGAGRRVLLLELADPVGLAVDEVSSVGALETVAGLDGRLVVEGEEAIRVVDLEALLRSAFATLATRREQRSAPAADAPDAGAGRARNEIVLMTFDLAGQAYALPLETVQEVTDLPAAVAALPRPEVADLGVVPFRGGVLPLVSLPALLGLPARPSGSEAKVVVARVGASLVGLVVDRMGVVLRAPEDALGPVPAVLNRGGGEASIEAICRLGDGLGLVSVLAPERLFRDGSLARILADGRQQEVAVAEDDSEAQRETFVLFRLGDEEYGLPIDAVEEVVRLPERLTRVPRAPAFIEGVMNVRGKAVPVIDQTRRFGAAVQTADAVRRVIVTAFGELHAGFIVDAVSEIVSLPADRLRPAPGLAAGETRLFDRVAHVGDEERVVLLVDPRALIDKAEADLLQALGTTAQPVP